MSRCVIHVGMHKTGTSSIQESLRGFADERFLYAPIGRRPNHSRDLFALLGFEHPEIPSPGAAVRRLVESRFRRAMAAAGSRTCLISGEGLALLPPGQLARLRQRLGEWFDDIGVVAAVRPPASYLASAFQERIRRLKRRMKGDRLVRYHGYRALFEKFDDTFGRARVTLWKFDPASYPGGCAVRDFCARLGIALPGERIVRVNDSLSREALSLLYIYRKLGGQWGSTAMTSAQSERLARALTGIGNTRFRFATGAVQPVLDRNRDDIEWMEARLGQSLNTEASDAPADGVRDESDLLRVNLKAVEELLARLGRATTASANVTSPGEVAGLVHELRIRSTTLPDRLRDWRPVRGLIDRMRVAFG